VGFRLRYLQHDLELAEGEFAIGRSATCQLSLDDPLVSRRHAVFTVAGGSVHVEDLSSRNGLLVNGQRIEGKVRVLPGDKVLIGSQELTLLQLGEADKGPGATGARRTLTINRAELVEDESITKVARPEMGMVDELSVVKRLDGFRVLGSVAEKALAMGRAEDAERVLATSLADVLDACRRGKVVPPSLAEQATRFAAKLASATGKGLWIDYVIEVYAAQKRPAPAVVVDELYGAFRKVSAVDVPKVKAYVEALRELLPSFGPADRFLFQRIEGLERLATLRA
jgi:predicted component of type VI protein secretion system